MVVDGTEEGMKTVIEYFFRGIVERSAGHGRYYTTSGYSAVGPNGGELQPWMTYRECQADAKAQGAKARFVNIRGGPGEPV